MKQVIDITKNPKDFVDKNDTNSSKYYGFILGSASAGYISADDMGVEMYRARFFYAMTRGNPWTGRCETIQECVEQLLNYSGESVVYEFDTYQELLLWGSKQ